MTTRSFGPYSFTLTREEFAAYASEVGRRQLAELDAKSWRLVAFALLALLAVLGGLATARTITWDVFLTGMLASAGATLIGRWMIRRQIARAQTIAIDDLAREGKVFAKPVDMRIDEEGLHFSMDGARDARPFAELVGAGRLAGMIVFWSGASDGVALPERALADSQEGEAILDFARARLRA